MEVDGAATLFVDVAGLPLADRPCTYQGRAYLRQADGDYEMSEQERTQIEILGLMSRTRVHDDAVPIDGSSMAELDPDLRATLRSWSGAHRDAFRASTRRCCCAAPGSWRRTATG